MVNYIQGGVRARPGHEALVARVLGTHTEPRK